MKQIIIGGIERDVPPGYTKLEAIYTAEASEAFYDLNPGESKEILRQVVLTQRVKFYNEWLDGKIIIPEEINPTPSFRERLISWLIS